MPVGKQCSENPPRDRETFLRWLVGVGVGAHGNGRTHVARMVEGLFKARDDVSLVEDLRFEIESGRQVQVGMRRPREAVDTTVLATLVRVDRLVERDVRRGIRRDEVLRPVREELRFRRRRRELRSVRRRPAVVHRLAALGVETARRIGYRAATLVKLLAVHWSPTPTQQYMYAYTGIKWKTNSLTGEPVNLP